MRVHLHVLAHEKGLQCGQCHQYFASRTAYKSYGLKHIGVSALLNQYKEEKTHKTKISQHTIRFILL